MTSILFQLVGDCCKSIEPVPRDVRFVDIGGVKYVPERTCKVTSSKALQGIAECECGNSFPDFYEFCPYCGAKVVVHESDDSRTALH